MYTGLCILQSKWEEEKCADSAENRVSEDIQSVRTNACASLETKAQVLSDRESNPQKMHRKGLGASSLLEEESISWFHFMWITRWGQREAEKVWRHKFACQVHNSRSDCGASLWINCPMTIYHLLSALLIHATSGVCQGKGEDIIAVKVFVQLCKASLADTVR